LEIVVRGRNTDIPSALRAATQEKLGRIERFVHDVTRIDVEFSEVRNKRVADHSQCEVLVHVKHHLLKAHAAAVDPGAALDLVVDKIESQAERLKKKRVQRSRPRHPNSHPTEVPFREPPAFEGEFEEDALIVKTKSFTIKPMLPEEAALHMELLTHTFYFFTNADTGRAAVIYRRHDGHLGLIEAAG
jgi:putative sigma-54 modulation protein